MWTLALGQSVEEMVPPSAPTVVMSWRARVITAKYCGKSEVTMRTSWVGRSSIARDGDDEMEDGPAAPSDVEKDSSARLSCNESV